MMTARHRTACAPVLALFAVALVLWPLCAIAGGTDQRTGGHVIKVIGRKNALVTTRTVTLGDVADISAAGSSADEAVIALQKIEIGASPSPGEQITVSAAALLEKLRAAGVDLQQVGYLFPRVVTVERASRSISKEEVAGAVERYLRGAGRDATLREVLYNNEARVAPGDASLTVLPFNTGNPGQLGFSITAAVANESPVNFKVSAKVDEWREIPVAKRPVARGAIVGEDDVMMARMNTNSLPRDAIIDLAQVLGLETSNDIGYGQTFRNNKLVMPPVVNAGARVTLIFKGDLFEATATGIALESGIRDQQIKVRNTSSKKIVMGKVVEPGLVRVGP